MCVFQPILFSLRFVIKVKSDFVEILRVFRVEREEKALEEAFKESYAQL